MAFAFRQPSRMPGDTGDVVFHRDVQFARHSGNNFHKLLTTPCCLDYGPRSHTNANDFRNAVDTAILYPCLLSA